MHQYDEIMMKRSEDDQSYYCHCNVVVEKELTSEQQDDMARYGYLFIEDDDDVVRILVNRLDVGALTTATNMFYQTYQ